MRVKFKRLHPESKIPKKATEFAGGWDVTVTEIEQKEKDLVICKLGFALEIQTGYKLTLVPRSSLTKTKWILQNSPGLGDSDFRNEYQYRFRALPNELGFNMEDGYFIKYPEFPFKVGDRIGQIYIEEVIPIEFIEVDELSDSNRLGGYGSTGR